MSARFRSCDKLAVCPKTKGLFIFLSINPTAFSCKHLVTRSQTEQTDIIFKLPLPICVHFCPFSSSSFSLVLAFFVLFFRRQQRFPSFDNITTNFAARLLDSFIPSLIKYSNGRHIAKVDTKDKFGFFHGWKKKKYTIWEYERMDSLYIR